MTLNYNNPSQSNKPILLKGNMLEVPKLNTETSTYLFWIEKSHVISEIL